jgi:putative Mn2+ efflux pump MntP
MFMNGIGREKAHFTADPSRGFKLVALSTPESIDAFAIDLCIEMFKISIWPHAVIIGIVISIVSSSGVFIGTRLNV